MRLTRIPHSGTHGTVPAVRGVGSDVHPDPEDSMAEEVHVHNTNPPSSGGGGAGWVVALLVVIVLAVVVWMFFVRGGDTGGVPEQIDVDVNVPSAPAPN